MWAQFFPCNVTNEWPYNLTLTEKRIPMLFDQCEIIHLEQFTNLSSRCDKFADGVSFRIYEISKLQIKYKPINLNITWDEAVRSSEEYFRE